MAKQRLGSRCLLFLQLGSGVGVFFFLFLTGLYLGMLPTALLAPLLVFWALGEVLFALGMFCVYLMSREAKHAFAGLLLVAASAFNLNQALGLWASGGLIEVAVQALAVVGVSLLLYELGRARPGSQLELAGGLIFLGVIFQIVRAPLFEAIGVILLLIGFLLASTRLGRL